MQYLINFGIAAGLMLAASMAVTAALVGCIHLGERIAKKLRG